PFATPRPPPLPTTRPTTTSPSESRSGRATAPERQRLRMDSDSVSATALARRPAPCDDAPPIRISGWVTIGPFSRADPGYRVGHPNNGKWITKKGPPKLPDALRRRRRDALRVRGRRAPCDGRAAEAIRAVRPGAASRQDAGRALQTACPVRSKR